MSVTYAALADRLATDWPDRGLVTFPDGSVDSYYDAFDAHGERLTERAAFADRVARGAHESIPIERRSREVGGQAVNMARQAHALGAETTCYGHLDDPVFADVPFETHSMGEPSRISIFSFDDEDLLLADSSPAYDGWSLADLEAVSPNTTARDALSGDAICCGNWVSVAGLTDAISHLASGPLEAGTFVLDPGAVRSQSRKAVTDLLDALGALDDRTDVVYSVNRAELEGTVAAIDGDSTGDGSDRENVRRVREAAGITAAVLHEVEIAGAATRAGVTTVDALDVDAPERRTGAGDRFSAGLAVGRAHDWEWALSLALGNACAAYAVENARTGDREALGTFVARKTE